MVNVEELLRSSLLGRYSFEEEIGTGALSAVSRAREPKHDSKRS